MMTLFVMFLLATELVLVCVVLLQKRTIEQHQEALRQRIAAGNRAQELIAAQGLHVQAQEQRYHLMWDIRRLHEQQIRALQAAADAMLKWIKAHGGTPPETTDEADWWKKQ